MSYFRNMSRVVPSSLFTSPNNMVLSSSFRPIFLQTSQEATIEYLHSAKALLSTIQFLEQARSTTGYQEIIQQELVDLEGARYNYISKVKEFVIKGGLLTAEGISNIYYGAQQFGFTPEWLQNNVHHSVPQKLPFMTRQNLVDTLEGLRKHHQSSPYISALEQQLKQKGEQAIKVVRHLPNETIRFEEGENWSSSPLVRAIERGQPAWRYKIESTAARVLNMGKINLHSL